MKLATSFKKQIVIVFQEDIFLKNFIEIIGLLIYHNQPSFENMQKGLKMTVGSIAKKVCLVSTFAAVAGVGFIAPTVAVLGVSMGSSAALVATLAGAMFAIPMVAVGLGRSAVSGTVLGALAVLMGIPLLSTAVPLALVSGGVSVGATVFGAKKNHHALKV